MQEITMTEEQRQHAHSAEEVLTVLTAFLRDDSMEFPDFEDLAQEALLNATIAARHARELHKRKALGQELAPLGYYLKDDELANQVNIDRLPGGGIWVDPV